LRPLCLALFFGKDSEQLQNTPNEQILYIPARKGGQLLPHALELPMPQKVHVYAKLTAVN